MIYRKPSVRLIGLGVIALLIAIPVYRHWSNEGKKAYLQERLDIVDWLYAESLTCESSKHFERRLLGLQAELGRRDSTAQTKTRLLYVDAVQQEMRYNKYEYHELQTKIHQWRMELWDRINSSLQDREVMHVPHAEG